MWHVWCESCPRPYEDPPDVRPHYEDPPDHIPVPCVTGGLCCPDPMGCLVYCLLDAMACLVYCLLDPIACVVYCLFDTMACL
eukprot:358075-Chlamydomonas_euryale.AAC.1